MVVPYISGVRAGLSFTGPTYFFYVKPVRKVRLRHTASISRLLYGEEPHGTGTSGIVKKDQEFGSSSGTSITSTSFSIGCLTQTEKKTITKSTGS